MNTTVSTPCPIPHTKAAKAAALIIFGIFLQALVVHGALKRGEVVFQSDFEKTNALAGWNGAAKLEEGYQSAHAVALARDDAKATAGSTISYRLSAKEIQGATIRGTAMIKADQVSPKPNAWNGIKMMLAIETPDRKLWPQANIGTGTFDWRKAGFTARIPPDATAVTLVLGLELVTGKVWFDDLKLDVAKAAIVRPAPQAVTGPIFTGHDLARLRGTMISPNIDAESLRLLGQDWRANLIRWQLIRFGRSGQPKATDDYDQWLDGELKRLDAALPLCEKYGIYIALDLHSPPGGKATSSGYVGSDDRLFTDKKCQDKLVEVWEKMARRYKGAKAIWGYDLVNEPVEDFVGEGCADWQELAERTARAIRAIDPERAIIVEPANWGGPDGLNDFAPIAVSNVVYSVHMYLPHAFTHQGVSGGGASYKYPGVIQGKMWDKAQLEQALKPAIDFQKTYGVQIYIGEFSAIRWAPENSGFRYLKDVIDIFEEHGWDWSYHAFREWSGWSVEHGSDKNDARRAEQPTDRQKLLMERFGKNQKPGSK